MIIETVATLAKSASIKREKDEKDVEKTFVHLKIAGLFVMREQVAEILNLDEMIVSDLYDEQGAPVVPLIVANPLRSFTATGVLRRGDGPSASILKVSNAEFEKLELILCAKGAYMSGSLSWEVAGDEASDLEPLLGRDCGAKLSLETDRQLDLIGSGKARQ